MKRKPVYEDVYHSIKKAIIDGIYNIGSLLPPEPELEKIYSVSRTTVRKAVDMLAKEGFVLVKQGFGTKVINKKTMQNLNYLTSVSQTFAKMGYKVGVKKTYIENIKSDEYLSNLFQINIDTPLVCIYRIQTIDGKPVSIVKNYILKSLVPDIYKENCEIVSLYEYLKGNFNVVFTTAKDIISACNATYEESQLLEIEPKTALINIQRSCYIDDSVCEVDLLKIIAEKYEFEIFMKVKND